MIISMTVTEGQTYRHYKNGKTYKIIGIGKHSETLGDVVVYETLYENPISKIWVRPLVMFEEMVEWPKGSGAYISRFTLVT